MRSSPLGLDPNGPGEIVCRSFVVPGQRNPWVTDAADGARKPVSRTSPL